MASTINAKNTTAGLIISPDVSGQLELQTVDTTRLTIDPSGNIGIGMTPDARFSAAASGFKTVNIKPTATASPASLDAGEVLSITNATSISGLTFSAGDPRLMSFGISPASELYIRGNALNIVATTYTAFTNGSGESIRIDTNRNVGIGLTPAGTGLLELAAGTATRAPFELNSGTLLTNPVAGTLEYDGVTSYFTNDTTSGRGVRPTSQIFRLTANGTAIGPAIGNFFGANSAINLAAGGVYEIEAYCYFTKTTAGTVTVTATTSLAPVNLNGIIQTGAATGGTASGGAIQIALFNSTATAAAFGATGSLTTGVNHAMIIKLIVEANASASNLRINFTSSAGTVTPLRGSYYKVTRLSAGNAGSFAA